MERNQVGLTDVLSSKISLISKCRCQQYITMVEAMSSWRESVNEKREQTPQTPAFQGAFGRKGRVSKSWQYHSPFNNWFIPQPSSFAKCPSSPLPIFLLHCLNWISTERVESVHLLVTGPVHRGHSDSVSSIRHITLSSVPVLLLVRLLQSKPHTVYFLLAI